MVRAERNKENPKTMDVVIDGKGVDICAEVGGILETFHEAIGYDADGQEIFNKVIDTAKAHIAQKMKETKQ